MVYINTDMPKCCLGCSTKVDPENRRCNIDGHRFTETYAVVTSKRDKDCPLNDCEVTGMVPLGFVKNEFEQLFKHCTLNAEIDEHGDERTIEVTPTSCLEEAYDRLLGQTVEHNQGESDS